MCQKGYCPKSVEDTYFGDNYEGILIRDRYAVYNGIGKEWQACLAHIRMNASEVKQEHNLIRHSV
ncbi:MAG: transposase [Desulfatiglans sp.]|nr:transposase [Desulfatiglans sp.]